MPQTAIFLVVYCELHYGGILVLVNKNTGLHFGFVEHIPAAQYMLGEKKKLLCIAFVLLHRT